MTNPLPTLKSRGFDLKFISHAEAILTQDFPGALAEIDAVLGPLTIAVEELVKGGGGESAITQRIRRAFAETGWTKHKFTISKLIDGIEKESISHEVDHVRKLPHGNIALEIEWNNKDPFFDRDLENFKRLHAEGAISAGVIVTRGWGLHQRMEEQIVQFAQARGFASLDDLAVHGIKPTDRQREEITRRIGRSKAAFPQVWARVFYGDKYGEATTHWGKLIVRIDRGVGNPCPLLLIGIPAGVVSPPAASPAAASMA